MAITAINQTRTGSTTIVTVTSTLAGLVFYHWYLDGAYFGHTTDPTRGFVLQPGDQSRLNILDTNDPDFDPIANAPAGYPARRTLIWIRSVDSDVVRYRIEQQQSGGAWETLGSVPADPRRWSYQFLSPRLDDLGLYAWRVIPIDAAGNDGTAISLGAETIVRTPDAPKFTATFQVGSTQVLFAAA